MEPSLSLSLSVARSLLAPRLLPRKTTFQHLSTGRHCAQTFGHVQKQKTSHKTRVRMRDTNTHSFWFHWRTMEFSASELSSCKIDIINGHLNYSLIANAPHVATSDSMAMRARREMKFEAHVNARSRFALAEVKRDMQPAWNICLASGAIIQQTSLLLM
jgi:hypothetical protein